MSEKSEKKKQKIEDCRRLGNANGKDSKTRMEIFLKNYWTSKGKRKV